jgi:hypothetical protein
VIQDRGREVHCRGAHPLQGGCEASARRGRRPGERGCPTGAEAARRCRLRPRGRGTRPIAIRVRREGVMHLSIGGGVAPRGASRPLVECGRPSGPRPSA